MIYSLLPVDARRIEGCLKEQAARVAHLHLLQYIFNIVLPLNKTMRRQNDVIRNIKRECSSEKTSENSCDNYIDSIPYANSTVCSFLLLFNRYTACHNRLPQIMRERVCHVDMLTRPLNIFYECTPLFFFFSCSQYHNNREV